MQKLTLFVIMLSFVVVACSDSSEPVDNTASARLIRSVVEEVSEPETVSVPEPEKYEEYVLPPPTANIGGYEIPIIEMIGVEELAGLTGRFRDEDPYREYFTTDGRVGTDYCSRRYARTHRVSDCLLDFAFDNRYLGALFLKAPVLVRREILNNLPPVLGEYLAEYLHPDYVSGWITDLDWDRDIEPLDPDEWRDTAWKEDDGLTEVDGYHEQVGQTDYWVRMFWKRRGQAVFEAVKTAVQAGADDTSP